MPELPEVETTRRILAPFLVGRSIHRIQLHQPGVIAHPSAAHFTSERFPTPIASLGRRGKYLWLDFADESRMVIHLRMTGALIVVAPAHPLEKHTHVVWDLSDGMQLRFSDPRRFGRIWHFAAGEPDQLSGLHRLGREPNDQVTTAYLRQTCGKRRAPIKNCLLDQHIIAGIGNIYADEILFASRIQPARQACSLTVQEWQQLAQAIPERIAFFTARNAIAAADFFAAHGRAYRNTPHLQVYGRMGMPCRVCHTILQRTVIGGRGSAWCPQCQT